MKNKIQRINFLLFTCKPQADIFATAPATQLHLVHRKLSFFCHSRPFTFDFYTADYSHELLMKASYLQSKKEGVCTTPGIQGCPAMPLKAITSTKRRDMTHNSSKPALDSAFGLPAPFTVSRWWCEYACEWCSRILQLLQREHLKNPQQTPIKTKKNNSFCLENFNVHWK